MSAKTDSRKLDLRPSIAINEYNYRCLRRAARDEDSLKDKLTLYRNYTFGQSNPIYTHENRPTKGLCV